MKTKYIIGFLAAAGISVAAISLAMASQQAYVTFDEAIAERGSVQVKGTWVKDSETSYDAERNIFHFTMADEAARALPVEFHGAKPNNFEMAEEVVVGGRYESGRFVATSLLTKCPSKYEADSIHVEPATGSGYREYSE